MSVFVDKNSNFIIGNNIHIGPNTAINCHSNIKIGDNSMSAWNCTIMNRDVHDITDLNSSTILNPIDSVFIGEHCWVYQNAIILKDSNIPDHSVVATKSIVTKKLEKTNCIYVNNKIVKENIDIKF